MKFQLTNTSGSFISTAITHLFLSKVYDGIAGSEEVALSTGGADSGNTLRYDTTSNQYIFNLDTGTLSAGTWQLKVVLNDGRSYVVNVSLR